MDCLACADPSYWRNNSDSGAPSAPLPPASAMVVRIPMTTNTLHNPDGHKHPLQSRAPQLSGLSWLLPNRGCEDSYGHRHPSQSRWHQTPLTIQSPQLSGLSWLLPNRGCEDSYGHRHPSQSRWPQTPFAIQSPPVEWFELVASKSGL